MHKNIVLFTLQIQSDSLFSSFEQHRYNYQNIPRAASLNTARGALYEVEKAMN